MEIHGKGKFNLLKRMDPKYAGEQLPGNTVWTKKKLGFDSEVKYLNRHERPAYKLTVKNGLIYDAQNRLFDSSTSKSAFNGHGAIFVMDQNGDLYASKKHAVGKFHHSSFLAGRPVAAAGEILVVNGRLKAISRQSGHYKPTEGMLYNAAKELARHGVGFQDVDLKYNIPKPQQKPRVIG